MTAKNSTRRARIPRAEFHEIVKRAFSSALKEMFELSSRVNPNGYSGKVLEEFMRLTSSRARWQERRWAAQERARLTGLRRRREALRVRREAAAHG